jgi:hypothetical protein
MLPTLIGALTALAVTSIDDGPGLAFLPATGRHLVAYHHDADATVLLDELVDGKGVRVAGSVAIGSGGLGHVAVSADSVNQRFLVVWRDAVEGLKGGPAGRERERHPRPHRRTRRDAHRVGSHPDELRDDPRGPPCGREAYALA